MKKRIAIFVSIEILVIGLILHYVIIPHWNKVPIVGDYTCLLFVGEIGVLIYLDTRDRVIKK